MRKISKCLISGLTAAALSACSSTGNENIADLDTSAAGLPTSTLSAAELTAANAKAANGGLFLRDDLVVEGLVNEANRLQYLGLDDSDEIEPVVPAVAMTANRIVERAINDHLQNRRTLLNIWIERGQTYFPMIEQIFAEEGVPDELKYIALGESSLRPLARSPMGAAGMWQFMPATGRSEGLEINTWIDERLDPERSTRAAARHLRRLYEAYSENWHLALAGYNCSFRCINNAVQRAGGTITDPPSFWEIYPYLPRETREFVPKFIAAALIVSNPEMYGITHENIGQEYSYDIVHVSGMLSLEDAAVLAGVDLATIRNLNPALLRSTLPDSAEPYPLRIPYGSYQRFVTAFASLPAEARTIPAEYIVRSGDTLGRIARDFETSVAQLQATNNIQGHLIRPGQRLLIPGRGVTADIRITSTQRQYVTYGEAMFRPIQLEAEFQLVEQAGSSPDAPLIAVSLSDDFIDELMVPTIYQVRAGDTLGQIAARFRVSVRDIQQWNNISGSTIYVNQSLTLHTAATAPAATQVYRVQRGDSLAAIARRFGVSVDNIKLLNGLSSDTIYPGQDLQLN